MARIVKKCLKLQRQLDSNAIRMFWCYQNSKELVSAVESGYAYFETSDGKLYSYNGKKVSEEQAKSGNHYQKFYDEFFGISNELYYRGCRKLKIYWNSKIEVVEVEEGSENIDISDLKFSFNKLFVYVIATKLKKENQYLVEDTCKDYFTVSFDY